MREFADVPASATEEMASRVAACGFEVAGIDGDVIDFEVTANRPDCLSVYGLAREAATAFRPPAVRAGGRAVRPAVAGPEGPASAGSETASPSDDRVATLRPLRAGVA